jgi:formate hydrogenlyase transcriptional activator
MTKSEVSVRVEAVNARIDLLTSRLASQAVGLRSEAIDATIADVLQQVGETLDVDYAALERSAEDAPSSPERKTWMRRAVATTCEPSLTIPVATGSRYRFAFIVGCAERPQPWPDEVIDRLRGLAHLLVLVSQRVGQLPERELDAPEARSLDVPPHRSFDGLGGSESIGGLETIVGIVGESPALRMAIARVERVATTDASVILLGETGTGKELFAQAVHNLSARRTRPFVCVNCAALPPTLIETELFGHVRGAFTGALSMRQGRFEMADGGTLFLDEIGDLPPDVQAKLLRVLQQGEFERVGSSQSRKVDVRIVAATHQDLEAAMNTGRFRPDLYYRLSVYPIVLPPLRERLDDIPRLVWHIVNRRQRGLNRSITSIPAPVFSALRLRAWPGNIRELENVIERAMIHSTGRTLQLDEEPGRLSVRSQDASTLEDLERRHVEDTLRRCRWRINGRGNAAELLGLHPNTLRNRMKKFGIHRPTGPVTLEPGAFRRKVATIAASGDRPHPQGWASASSGERRN